MTAVTIAQLINERSLLVSDGYRTKRAELGSPGYRIIRVADVRDGSVSLNGPDHVADSFGSAIGAKAGMRGDILLTTKGTVGRVAVLPELAERVVYSPQLCFFRVIDETRLSPGYLRYWFLSRDFADQASYLMNNTDMAAYINLADIRALSLSLPEFDEQRAIAEVLGALDDKIATNTKLARTADSLGRAKTRTSVDRRVAPTTLSDVALVTMGSSPPGDTYNELGIGVPFYQGVRDFGMRYPTRRVWTTGPVRMAQAGDSLLSVRAPVGEVNLASEPTCIGRGLASIRSITGAPATLFHLLKDAEDVWAPFEAEGTVFGSINQSQLKSLKIPVVRADYASRVEAELTALESTIRAALEETRTLATIRDTLLPELMSGRLQVKDVEALAETVL